MTQLVGVVGRFWRWVSVVAAVGCVGLLGLAGTAAAAETVTVGATLPIPAGPQVSSAFLAIPGGFVTIASSTVSDPAIAPFGGTVTGWSIQGASVTPGYSVSVFHKNADGSYTVTAQSAKVTPTGAEPFESFATDLPIEAGEYVGLDVPATGFVTDLEGVPGGSFGFIFEQGVGSVLPAISTGEKPTTTALAPSVMAYNAEIEAAPTPPPTGAGSEPGTSTGQPAGGGNSTASPSSSPSSSPSAPAPRCVVPKLDGKKLAAAKQALRAGHCKVGRVSLEHGHGSKPARVVKQSPKPGTSLTAGAAVGVKLG